eukprot:gene6828-13833_t
MISKSLHEKVSYFQERNYFGFCYSNPKDLEQFTWNLSVICKPELSMNNERGQDAAEIDILKLYLLRAQEELQGVEAERDDALKALHAAEWEIHEIEKDNATDIIHSDVLPGSVNLETRFQEQFLFDELQKKLNELESRNCILAAKEEEISKTLALTKSKSEIEKTIQGLKIAHEADINSWKARVKVLSDKLTISENENDVEIKKMKELIANLESELMKSRQNEEALHKTIAVETENVSKDKASYEKKIKDAQAQMDKLTNELSTLSQTSKEKLDDAVKSAEKKTDEIRKEFIQKKEISDVSYKSTITTLESNVKSLTTQLSAAKIEEKRLQTALQSSITSKESNEQKIEKISNQLRELQKSQAEVEARTGQADVLLSSLRDKEADMIRREDAIKRANEGLEKKVSTLKASKEALQLKADAAEARATVAETNLSKLEKAKLKAEKDVARLTKQLDEALVKIAASATSTVSAEKPRDRASTTEHNIPTEKKEKATAITVDKQKPDKAKNDKNSTTTTTMTIREELIIERRHKYIAIAVSILFALMMFATLAGSILSNSTPKRFAK